MNRKQILAIGSAAATIGGLFIYSSMNTQFDLFMPDSAKINGTVLSPDNFSRLQKNVGVFTVYQPHATSQAPTTGYCPMAKFIHEHEDGYNGTHVGNTTIYNATIPPKWCEPELDPSSIPEFPPAAPVLLSCIAALMALSRFQPSHKSK